MIGCRKIGAAAAFADESPTTRRPGSRRPTPLRPHPVASGPAPPPFCPNKQATGNLGYRHAAGTFTTSHLAPTPQKHTHPGLL